MGNGKKLTKHPSHGNRSYQSSRPAPYTAVAAPDEENGHPRANPEVGLSQKHPAGLPPGSDVGAELPTKDTKQKAQQTPCCFFNSPCPAPIFTGSHMNDLLGCVFQRCSRKKKKV